MPVVISEPGGSDFYTSPGTLPRSSPAEFVELPACQSPRADAFVARPPGPARPPRLRRRLQGRPRLVAHSDLEPWIVMSSARVAAAGDDVEPPPEDVRVRSPGANRCCCLGDALVREHRIDHTASEMGSEWGATRGCVS